MSDAAKRAAARRALDLVEDGLRLGLGTGSTAALFVAALGERVASGLDVIAVPTSEATHRQAEALGIRLATLEEQPDLVLMDMSLPVLDGWEATRRIKADPAPQAIPVIALTAHAMAADRENALAAGCDDYDTKPIELSRLLEKMQRLLPTG